MISRFAPTLSGSRPSCRVVGVLLILVGLVLAASCNSVPLLAPSGSTITLTASSNAIPANGTAQLIAYVLEQSGTPPHPGTQVIFTTNLGVVEPGEAITDINGRAQATFRGNGQNGTATINAVSGAASTAAVSNTSNNNNTTAPATNNSSGPVRISVGTAAVGRVVVNPTPATIPSGGSSSITATVYDVNGSPLAATAVSFSTDAGTLSSSVVTTNGEGVATTSLTTSQTATVTASVGATAPPATGGGSNPPTTTTGQTSGTAKVTVVPNSTVSIGLPNPSPSAGLPAVFTFTVTIPQGGNQIRELRVNWGDGSGTQNLGAISGQPGAQPQPQSASHVYDEAGTYLVTATIVDAVGVAQSVSSTVTVIPIPRPTVLVTATPPTQVVGGVVNVAIQVTIPPGIGVVRTRILFGDGEIRELGGATSATVAKIYSAPNSYTIRVIVTDTTGQDTEGTTTVSITSPG